MRSSFSLPLVKKELVAKDTWTFSFDRTKIPTFSFVPGQYSDISFPGLERKSFTISSSPLEKVLTITTKIQTQHSLFKEKLMSLTPGKLILFQAPLGAFTISEKKGKSYVFLSGGMGITPFHSMILFTQQKKLTIPITLFASFARQEDMVFYQELKCVAKNNAQIQIVYTLTKEIWSEEKGRISEKLIRKYVKDIMSPEFLIAGPTDMVHETLMVLEHMKVPLEHMRMENFTGY